MNKLVYELERVPFKIYLLMPQLHLAVNPFAVFTNCGCHGFCLIFFDVELIQIFAYRI